MTETNPYRDETPAVWTQGEIEVGPGGEIQLPAGQRKGWVGHVPAVGWLMILSSVLSLIFVVGLFAIAFFIPQELAAEAAKNPNMPDQGMPPEQVAMLLQVVCSLMGLGLAVISALGLVAGIQTVRFRSRTLGITALSAGFFSMLAGFYCFPIWLLVGIYGLVVMLNPQVKKAFELRTKGCTAKQIRDAFRSVPK